MIAEVNLGVGEMGFIIFIRLSKITLRRGDIN